MLSVTTNRVKVDAGPLVTRFKDAETGDLDYAGVFSTLVSRVELPGLI